MMRRLPVIVILAGILLLGLSLGTAYFQHPESLHLPPKLADRFIHHKFVGPEAIDEFAALHEHWFPLSGGAVGHYGPDDELSLWVARAPFAWLAGRMVEAMHEKIGEAKSPFQAVGVRNHFQHTIYMLTGMGQSHFYYQAGHSVVWLSAEPALVEQALSQVLEVYH